MIRSGIELDTIIAEKILGYTPLPLKVEDDPKSLWPDQYLRDSLIAAGLTHYPPPDQPQKVCGVPPVSTDIAAAWIVVEELGLFDTYGQSIGGYFLHREVSNRKWAVSHRWGAVVARGETVPHVICLAAIEHTTAKSVSPKPRRGEEGMR